VLRGAGKPYNSALLNVHKLIALAAAVLFIITVVKINKASGLSTLELAMTIVTGILLLGAIVSGGLSSISTMPIIVVRIHQITLSLATVFVAITLYFLLHGK
jgi:heme A synthase